MEVGVLWLACVCVCFLGKAANIRSAKLPEVIIEQLTNILLLLTATSTLLNPFDFTTEINTMEINKDNTKISTYTL